MSGHGPPRAGAAGAARYPLWSRWRWRLWPWLLSAHARVVCADYFPFTGTRPLWPATPLPDGSTGGTVAWHSKQWKPPLLQPWEPLRATSTSITVTWTPAWNAWCDVSYYELQARRPAGPPLQLAGLVGVQFREADLEVDLPFEQHAAWADQWWTSWGLRYTGRGRSFTEYVPLGTPHAVQFRVRACGKDFLDGCSDWSPVQTTHTILNAFQDRINFFVRGTGKNAHNYTVLEFNQITIYKRRDETGLVLAIFSRLDLSLQWLKTYDTHRNRSEALQMSKDIRLFNQSNFVVVASSIAWEWHAPQSLVKTMEYCGAYHFGQWAYIFAEQKHYESNESDLQGGASQAEFGHPYAFIGIPGIGAGMGWESLMHNTGHYLPRNVNPQHAIIRGIAYYDYVFRIYRLQDVTTTKADFYLKGSPPYWQSFHNPIPSTKVAASRSGPIVGMEPVYTPYLGLLQNAIPEIMEANETVPPYNFAFYLVTVANVIKVDPRPRTLWVTELERIWEGASARYWQHNGSLFNLGLALNRRSCSAFITYGYTLASPESCGSGFRDCCTKIDAPGLIATQCATGVAPTLCKNSTIIQLQNMSALLTTKWPYPFRVITWSS